MRSASPQACGAKGVALVIDPVHVMRPVQPSVERMRSEARNLPVWATIFAVALCVFFVNSRTEAQQATAQINGTVKDATGAVVVGAKVTLRNSDTNVTRDTTSNKDGDYQFTLIPIGTYELKVERQGFDTYMHRGITLDINQNAHVDVSLTVGAALKWSK